MATSTVAGVSGNGPAGGLPSARAGAADAALLLRFAALMMRSGTTTCRVRQQTQRVARGLGLDHVDMHASLDGLTVTVGRGGDVATVAARTVGYGINARRIALLQALAHEAEAGIEAVELHRRLDVIERMPPEHSIATVAVAVGLACGAFSFMNGGGIGPIVSAMIGAGLGQAVRSLLFARRINQFAVTGFAALVASGGYLAVSAVAGRLGLGRIDHAAGFISAILFLVPGFPLVAGLLDLLRSDLAVGVTRLAYGLMLLLAAGFGTCLFVVAAGLTTVTPSPPALDPAELWALRLLASFIGGCGFAVLYNSPWRTVLIVGVLALIGNDLRLALNAAGVDLWPATFFGAFSVGLLASLARLWFDVPRISLSIPGIIIMVPGTFAYETAVLFAQGSILDGIRAGVMVVFIVSAMALGIAASRFLTDRDWMFEN